MRSAPKELFLVEAYVNLALSVARTGACERAQVGCVLTPPDLHNVLAIGYNGPASGLPNKCARPDQPGNCGCVHAEVNACIKAPSGPKWAFTSIPPCGMCAAALINSGVECVVYANDPHREINEGMDLLEAVGIPCGKPEQILDLMFEMSAVDQDQTARSAFEQEWSEDDISDAKASLSRFAEG